MAKELYVHTRNQRHFENFILRSRRSGELYAVYTCINARLRSRNSWDNFVLSEPSAASLCNRIAPRLRVFYLDIVLSLSRIYVYTTAYTVSRYIALKHGPTRKRHELAILIIVKPNTDEEMFLRYFLKICIATLFVFDIEASYMLK